MSSGCFIFFRAVVSCLRLIECQRRQIEAPAVIYTFLKTVCSYILAQCRRRGDAAALTSRPSEQGEVNLERRMTTPLPLLSLPHWGQQSTIFSSHSTHALTHTQIHTLPCHNTLTDAPSPSDRPENQNYTTKPSV